MRTSLYNKQFHPIDYIELASDGKTRAEICKIWEISRDTLNRWEKDPSKQELSDAISMGDTAREAFYIEKLRDIAFCKIPGNIRAFIWLTQNTLKWNTPEKSDAKKDIEFKIVHLNDRPKKLAEEDVSAS